MKRLPDISVIEKLQKQILALQGNQNISADLALPLGLGALESAFPGGVFAKGAVHELISNCSEDAACTSSFIGVVLNKLMKNGGHCLWISTIPRRSIFPPGLTAFGVNPDHVLFVDTPRLKDTLWVLEEALKCEGVAAVVGELSELSFQDSRRLQLAVEKSQVTGFIHRFRPKAQNPVACVSRWKITSAATNKIKGGLGFPKWNVELLKVKNGHPDRWLVQYTTEGLEYITPQQVEIKSVERKIG